MKRVVLKEELAAVTGDFKLAMVLNQMMYWALRTRSAAAYRKETAAGEAAEHGWIYKSSEELAEEMMMNVSACSMRTYLKKLVGLGFLLERSNPHQKWDKTKQYRVQWKAVESAAAAAGWELEDSWKNWTVPEPPSFSSKEKNSGSKPEKPEAVSESIAETSTKSPSLLSVAYETVFGKPRTSVKKKLEDWSSSSFFQDGEKIVLYALETAAVYQARSFAYVEKMLRSWIDKGARTLEEVKGLMEKKTVSAMPKSTGKNSPFQEKERLLAQAEAAHWREVLRNKKAGSYSRNV